MSAVNRNFPGRAVAVWMKSAAPGRIVQHSPRFYCGNPNCLTHEWANVATKTDDPADVRAMGRALVRAVPSQGERPRGWASTAREGGRLSGFGCIRLVNGSAPEMLPSSLWFVDAQKGMTIYHRQHPKRGGRAPGKRNNASLGLRAKKG